MSEIPLWHEESDAKSSTIHVFYLRLVSHTRMQHKKGEGRNDKSTSKRDTSDMNESLQSTRETREIGSKRCEAKRAERRRRRRVEEL